MAEVTEMLRSEAEEAPDTPPESTLKPPTSTPPSKKPPGKPPKAAPESQPQFFERVAAVPREDWGHRAYMYVYVSEPVMNAKTFGDTKYLLKSSQPILDLEGLKQDYGSFKGWMTLNTRKSGNQVTDEIDRYEFTIFDIKCPPKFPVKSWANDPKNERWRALLPPEKPSASEAAGTMLDAMKVYKEIRNEVKEEYPAAAAPTEDDTDKTLRTMKLAKDLFAPAAPATAPAAPADPFTIAGQIMQMRANDPMIAALMQRLDSADKSLEAAREREFKLQMQLMEKAAAPAKSGDFLDKLLDLTANTEKVESIKKLFGGLFGVGGAGESVTRSGRLGGYEVVRDIFSSPFGEKLGEGLGTLIGSIAKTGPPTAGSPVAPQTNGAHAPVSVESDQQRIQRIAQTITNPMISEFFDQNEPGDTFAERVYDLWPQDFLFLQKLGATTIVDLYRQHNQQLWAYLAPREAQFRDFVAEFCAYQPGADDAIDSTADADDVIDLEAEPQK